MEHVFAIPHKTLANNTEWALGIVTGNNSKHVHSQSREGLVPVFKGSDITTSGVKTATHFISEDFSTFQQVAPLKYYKAKEKIIYKFISSKLVFHHDTKQRYILNSANLLIPSCDLGIDAKQLADLLSSDLMNWVFNSLFKTHKILRKDLELLPIHVGYFDENENFQESTYLDFLGLLKDANGTYRIKAKNN